MAPKKIAYFHKFRELFDSDLPIYMLQSDEYLKTLGIQGNQLNTVKKIVKLSYELMADLNATIQQQAQYTIEKEVPTLLYNDTQEASLCAHEVYQSCRVQSPLKFDTTSFMFSCFSPTFSASSLQRSSLLGSPAQ